MKNSSFFLFLLTVTILSCRGYDDEKEGWSLHFVRIDTLVPEGYNGPRFELEITSSFDLAQLYSKEKGASIYMFCPLTKVDFSPDHIGKEEMKLGSVGILELKNLSSLPDSFVYRFPVDVLGRNGNNLQSSEIDSALDGKNCIDCKMIIAFLQLPPRVNLTSEPFCIPADSVLKLLEE